MKRKKHSMNKKLSTLVLLAFALIGTTSAMAGEFDHQNSSGRQLLLRSPAIASVAARHGLTLLDSISISGSTLYLVEGPAGQSAAAVAQSLLGDQEVTQAEVASLALLPAKLATNDLLLEAAADISRTGTYATACQNAFMGESWAGYSDQRAARSIRVAEAHAQSLRCGSGVTVAVIDTGVDETHPLLSSAVLPGFDVFEDTGTGSDWSNLDHSVRAIVEHSVRAIVEGSAQGQAFTAGGAAAVLGEDAVLAFHDAQLPPYFGHGTMVAGLVRLVAPGAQILPIRAFDGNGTANVYDLVRAIYWATDQGAQVINMSFSLGEAPLELRNAIRYAEAHGVVLVAAAGNQGDHARLYPAAFNQVIGVAAQSTLADGSLASFSNFGMPVAEIAAPGSAVITTFPGGLYSASWGTSFSSPLVAGTAALILERPLTASCGVLREIERDLLLSAVQRNALLGKVLSGQLDVYRAWQQAGN